MTYLFTFLTSCLHVETIIRYCAKIDIGSEASSSSMPRSPTTLESLQKDIKNILQEIERIRAQLTSPPLKVLLENLDNLQEHIKHNCKAVDKRTADGKEELTKLVNGMEERLERLETTIRAAGQAETKLREIVDEVKKVLDKDGLKRKSPIQATDSIMQQETGASQVELGSDKEGIAMRIGNGGQPENDNIEAVTDEFESKNRAGETREKIKS
jgi:chromosome segregation ATPase